MMKQPSVLANHAFAMKAYNNHITAGYLAAQVPLTGDSGGIFYLSPDLSPQGRGGVQRWSKRESVVLKCGQELKDGARYTYISCYPESLLPSLVGRGRGRGKMQLRMNVCNNHKKNKNT
jgi:hypothetical protein